MGSPVQMGIELRIRELSHQGPRIPRAGPAGPALGIAVVTPTGALRRALAIGADVAKRPGAPSKSIGDWRLEVQTMLAMQAGHAYSPPPMVSSPAPRGRG